MYNVYAQDSQAEFCRKAWIWYFQLLGACLFSLNNVTS